MLSSSLYYECFIFVIISVVLSNSVSRPLGRGKVKLPHLKNFFFINLLVLYQIDINIKSSFSNALTIFFIPFRATCDASTILKI